METEMNALACRQGLVLELLVQHGLQALTMEIEAGARVFCGQLLHHLQICRGYDRSYDSDEMAPSIERYCLLCPDNERKRIE